MKYKNDRTANHGDSIITPSGKAGTLRILNMSMDGSPTTKIALGNASMGATSSEPVEVGECYHAEDAYEAIEGFAALQNEHKMLTESLTASQTKVAELSKAVADLTQK